MAQVRELRNSTDRRALEALVMAFCCPPQVAESVFRWATGEALLFMARTGKVPPYSIVEAILFHPAPFNRESQESISGLLAHLCDVPTIENAFEKLLDRGSRMERFEILFSVLKENGTSEASDLLVKCLGKRPVGFRENFELVSGPLRKVATQFSDALAHFARIDSR